MASVSSKFKQKVSERVSARCAQIGFVNAKIEFYEIVQGEYLLAQSALKMHQETYHEFGLIDYYKMQHSLIELRGKMLQRTEEDWVNSIKDSKLLRV